MLTYLLSLVESDADKLLITNIVNQYERRVYAVCLKNLHNERDAEDAMMDTWVKVIGHLETAKRCLNESASIFEAWVTTIAKNVSLDEIRKKKRSPEPIEMWDIPSQEDIEEKVQAEDALNRLKNMIKAMPREARAVLEMRMFAGYSFKEIGKSMRCFRVQKRVQFCGSCAISLAR